MSLLFVLGRSLLAAIVFDNILAVIGFVRNGLTLPQSALERIGLNTQGKQVIAGIRPEDFEAASVVGSDARVVSALVRVLGGAYPDVVPRLMRMARLT